MSLSQRRVGCRFNADHAAFSRALLDHVVRFHAWAVPQRTGSHVSDKNGLFTYLDRVQRRLIPRMRHVNGHADAVHALNSLATEVGQAAVALLFKTTSQGVSFAVSDAHHPNAK